MNHPRKRELDSLERMSLGWAWNDAKNAVRLAVELLRWGTPPSKWVSADDPTVAALDAHLGAAQPTDDRPYRTVREQCVNVDHSEIVNARSEIANLLTYLTALGAGQALVPPEGFGGETEHVMTRLYWYADIMDKRISQACGTASRVEKDKELQHRWKWIAHAAVGATEFIRKFATQNPTIGSIDGISASILRRIGSALARSGRPTEEIVGRMFHWRIRDALKGKPLSDNLETDLRAAFEAAWLVDEYEFAYALFADLDSLR